MKFSSATGLVAATAGLVLVLSACAAPAETGSSGDVTINYWSWDGAPGKDLITPIIADFEAANPGVVVKYTEIPQGDYKAKVAQSLGAGEKIDVLGVQPGTWAGEVEDYLVPVADYVNGAALVDSLSATAIAQSERLFTDGELMAIPLYSTGSAIGIYNADILADLGLAAPSTWADFKAMSDALAAQGSGILPMTMPGEDWFQDEAALTAVGQVDPEFFNSVRYDEGDWSTPSYVEGLRNYAELFKNGTFDKATLDMDYGTAMTTFDSGKSAVVFNGSWETGRILTGNYGVVPFPAETVEQASARAFLDVMVAVPAASENQDAAASFIEYLAAGDGVDVWASALKGIPAVANYELPEGVLTTSLQQESYATLIELITKPAGDRNNMGAFSDFAGANVKQVLFGTMTPQEAADSSQAELIKGNF